MRGRVVALWAAALAAASAGIFWPGFVEYDSVGQYAQVLSGQYDDWHPPVMARLWRLFGPNGAGPMLLIQLGGWWLGIGLIAAALAATRPRAAIAVLAIGLFPAFLGWQAVVLKDAQMVAALVAAIGILGWWRLRGQRCPWPVLVVAALLLGYASLVRANAVFAVAPLVAVLGTRRWPSRLAVTAGLIGSTLAVSPWINHRLLDAARSGVEQTQPLFDLAGIAVRTGAGNAALASTACYTPFFWDPLGDPGPCGEATAAWRRLPTDVLYARWLAAIVHHPLGYAAHRAAHLNSTWRLWVPRGWPNATAPEVTEPNDLRLGGPGRAAVLYQKLANLLLRGPTGWPVLWLAAALVGLAARPGRLSAALFASAVGLEASFAVVSVASDLRYHLWPMVATALGWVLILDGRTLPRRLRLAATAMLLLLFGVALAARLMLPPMG